MKFLSNIPENDVYLVSKLAATLNLPIKIENPGRNFYGIPVKESAMVSVPDSMDAHDYTELWFRYNKAKERFKYRNDNTEKAPEDSRLRKPRFSR